MTMDWERLGDAVRRTRKELGLTQRGLAAAAGVSEATVQLYEQHKYSDRLPFTIKKVEAALGWAPGSGRAILAGGDPTPLKREPEQDSADSANVVTTDPVDLPLRIVQELSTGPLLDATVMDLTPHGSDARMIVVVRGTPNASSEQIRADLLAWERRQKWFERADDEDDDAPPDANEA